MSSFKAGRCEYCGHTREWHWGARTACNHGRCFCRYFREPELIYESVPPVHPLNAQCECGHTFGVHLIKPPKSCTACISCLGFRPMPITILSA